MKARDLLKHSTRWQRIRWTLVWLVSLYLAWMYVRMGLVKFNPEGFWTAAFERWGYPVWLRLAVGTIETVGGALLLVPWTATYSALAVAAVMVGAWITRFSDGWMGDVAWITAYLAALLWVAFEWRMLRWPRFGKAD